MALTTVQAIPTTSSLFQPDQVLDFSVDYWDTPMTALEADVASSGIPMDIRQPKPDYTFTLKTQLLAATAANCASTFSNSSYSASIVGTDGSTGVPTGRIPNLIKYWAGGAPGDHGAQFAKQVAYHFSAYMRPVTGREWWSATASPTFCLALAGSGYVRITKTVSGVTSDVTYKNVSGSSVAINRTISEGDYLQNGLLISDSMTLAPGDRLDIYYVQDRDDWGGFVFKAVASGAPTTAQVNTAPVVCAGIFDSGTQPTRKTFNAVKSVNITRTLNAAADAQINLALANSSQTDKVGWEFIRTSSNDDPGILRYNDGFTTYDISRSRLIRVKAGFSGEQYTVFVGHIDDFADLSSGTITVMCKGFEQRMGDQFVKNYPDKLSYMTVGYKKVKGISEPVYDITAFDNWPLEYALKELARRAGLDESVSSQPLQVTVSNGTTSAVTLAGETFNKFRAKTPPTITDASGNLVSSQIKVERQVHYGNVGRGFDPAKAPDDEYLFPPENKDDIFSACKHFVDKYGYDMWFDELGHWTLKGANNFAAVYTADASFGQSPTIGTNPDAIKGTYAQWTNTVNPIIKSITAARIDLVVPRGVNHGSWAYTVKKVSNGVTVASGTINPAIASGADEFFYDYRTTIDGTNSTVTTLYSGDYQAYSVTLQSSGTGALTRRIDSLLLWHTDPTKTRYSAIFGTDANAMSVDAKGTMDDARNHVIVVGRRKAVVTDSPKFNTDSAINPNNPDSEFVVERAVDYKSIIDPTAKNYLGYTKESIIYDSSITDLDFAGYLARTFIYRYRVPRAGADITHSIVPMLQLKEPITVNETLYDTIDPNNVVWVTTMKHSLEYGKFTTDFGATSYISVASYEPRQDVDIDALFAGAPVSGVKIAYTSLANTACSNLGDQEEYIASDTLNKQVSIGVTAGSPNFLDMTNQAWPPVPGTLFLKARTQTPVGNQYQQVFNNPTSKTLTTDYIIGLETAPTSVGISAIWLSADPNAPLGTYDTYDVSNISKSSTAPTRVNNWFSVYYSQDTLNGKIIIHLLLDSGVDYPAQVVVIVNYNSTTADTGDWTTDNPYHHFTNIDYRTGGSQKRIYLPWKQGDNTSIFNLPAVSEWFVRYRALGPVDGSNNFSDPYVGTSPFFDPYTSELGYLVSINYDALVSGNYRISIRNVDDDTVVAWLTEPTGDPAEPEAHWSFVTAGGGKQLAWDGVDDVGTWNKRQSEIYAAAAYGAFEQQDQPVIGKGFYAWNQEVSKNGAFPNQALISGAVDATTGAPVFCHNTFSKWYVKFEVTSETIAQIAATNDAAGGTSSSVKANPRVLNTTTIDPVYNADCIKVSGTATVGTANTMSDTGKAWRINQWKGYQVRLTSGTGVGQLRRIVSNTATQIVICATTSDPNIWSTNPVAGTGYNIESTSAMIYTHLPDPTKVELVKVSDWFNVSNYSETSPPSVDAGNWQDTPTADAVVHNGKPVRIRFKVMPRQGTLWSGNDAKISFRLYRIAHLTTSIFDQFTVFNGYNYPGTATESRVVASRKLMNNDHTISFSDGAWLYGDALKQNTSDTSGYEWIFLPKYFKKDFRGIQDESLQFMDYLQLEEVPKWNNNRQIAGERSRLHYALMNYLFYLSAYTQDRSGRFSWCLDRTFIDRSKIIKNAYADWYDPSSATTPRAVASSSTYRNEWPLDPNTQHRRTVIVRQWQDESTWRADQNTKWAFGGAGTLGYELLRHKFKDHSPSATNLNATAWSSFGNLKVDQHSKWFRDGRTNLPTEFGTSPNYLKRQFGDAATLNALGKWTWETAPYWIPCVTRDHHGYYMLPPMIDKNTTTYNYRTEYVYGQVDGRGYVNDEANTNEGDDVAAATVWSSVAFDMNETYSSSSSGIVRLWAGTSVNPLSGPAKDRVNVNTMDYLRQDEMNHYEDFRGIYSRGPRPQEAPKKITSTSPYYVNPYRYNTLSVRQARKQPLYPDFYATIAPDGFFQMKFRYEYLWESGSLFPTDDFGRERLRYMNAQRAQIEPRTSMDVVRFDSGAWAGWKDDIDVSNDADVNYLVQNSAGVFSTGYMPVARGPRLYDPAGNQITTDMIFGLVLVNERRSQPIGGV